MSEWKWIDFSLVKHSSGRDSFRASHQLYEFITMFGIDDFKVIQQDGEWQNASIEAVYKSPEKYKKDEVEDKWYEYLESWKKL